NVDTCRHYPDKASPRPEAVLGVPDGDPVPQALARASPCRAGKAVQPAAHPVTEGMARKGVHHQEKGIDDEKHGAKADAEPGLHRLAVDYLVRVVKAPQRAVPQDRNEDKANDHGKGRKLLKQKRSSLSPP